MYTDHCKLKTVYCSIYMYTSQATLVHTVSLRDIPDILLDLQILNPHLLRAIQMDSRSGFWTFPTHNQSHIRL